MGLNIQFDVNKSEKDKKDKETPLGCDVYIYIWQLSAI